MATYDIRQCFLDNQWVAHHEEVSWLVWRKLSPHLSALDRKVLKHQLSANDEEPDCCTFVTPEVIELSLESIYQTFGVRGLHQLVRWAVYRSEEEIKVCVEC